MGSPSPALREKNKRDRDDILWPDTRVEKPLARLYTDILDEAGPWGSVQMSAGGIMKRYGIAKNTVYKLLSDPPKWLEVEALPGEGYRLTIRPVRQLTDRAYDLLMEKSHRCGENLVCIDKPENVRKGERNHWLVTIILTCKWKGIGQRELRAMLDQIIKRVPGWQKSQSLARNLGSIVRSLYHHRSSLKGKSPDQILPEWLLAALQPARPNRLSQKIRKKGSRRDLEPCSANPVTPERDTGAVVLPFQAPSSPIPGEVRPVVRGGPGPWVDSGTGIPNAIVPEFFSAAVHTGQTEIHPAGRAVSVPSALGPDAELASGAESGDGLSDVHPGGQVFAHLSGSALSSAFSKALMKSALPAAEKARILTEVTSIANVNLKEKARREWLAHLARFLCREQM
ncbi:MAG TPA: hypothetical protein VE954_17125 [Oligoflexus sp.]|uniref:hypothetical protein n=1 Tax=Oligoflexus sp. TaxID=1971216 RepID=UPI002D5DC89C|nr:hypothetical protein [Oligoflexus sp.]HYX34822.1 hypothetical protein [Oligoflexus sp.]